MNALLAHRATKPTVFLLALWPFAWLVHGALTHALGANPAEALLRGTGDWVLRLLCLTLLVTPLRERDIVWGRIRGLWRQFAAGFVVLGALAWWWSAGGYGGSEFAE